MKSNNKEVKLLNKIYNDLLIEKHSCSSNEEPHCMAECKDARYSIKEYLNRLIYEYNSQLRKKERNKIIRKIRMWIWYKLLDISKLIHPEHINIYT